MPAYTQIQVVETGIRSKYPNARLIHDPDKSNDTGFKTYVLKNITQPEGTFDFWIVETDDEELALCGEPGRMLQTSPPQHLIAEVMELIEVDPETAKAFKDVDPYFYSKSLEELASKLSFENDARFIAHIIYMMKEYEHGGAADVEDIHPVMNLEALHAVYQDLILSLSI